MGQNNEDEEGIVLKGNVTFTNWSRTFTCFPLRSFYPASRSQVKRIIEIARSSNRKIRVVGGGLSPSDLVCSQDYLVYTDRLDKILEVDHEKFLIKVQAGIKISTLNTELEKLGLSISNLASVSSQSLAGAVGSCTHGTGIKFGAISTQITEVVFIDGLGNRRVVSDKVLQTGILSKESDLYLAVLCHLGCLGIIVEMTLKVEPFFNLEIRQYPASLSELVDNFEDLLGKCDHLRLWWHPHVSSESSTKDTLVWSASRTTDKEVAPKFSWFWDRFVRVNLFEFLLFCGRYFPVIIPAINKAYFKWFALASKREVKKSYEGFNFDCLFSQHVSEWAIPLDKTKEALLLLADLLNNQSPSRSQKISAHFPIEIRFVAKDDILLSPAQGQNICYIGIIMYRPYDFNVEYKEYWNSFEEIMMSLGGRPHWAKAHSLTPKQLASLYPKMNRFLEIRYEMDPKGMFVNDYIQRHLLSDCNT
ncbi:D-arabinono-1,4-lactone oxidase [Entomophthora muscae]|uniref:D-arabinono-1,4-lactone oxidase n=1 Tax=Entomophthora muscae TaxID=34485 RepID=A0ACC2SKH8_9FUNG|nr:D-arabinono-1,4-lactone oxidase [Entomophthora muscae]